MFKFILISSISLIILTACGYKGPLYLAPKKTASQPTLAKAPTNINTLESQTKILAESNVTH